MAAQRTKAEEHLLELVLCSLFPACNRLETCVSLVWLFTRRKDRLHLGRSSDSHFCGAEKRGVRYASSAPMDL